MAAKRRKPRRKAGLPPGSLVYLGAPQVDKVEMSLVHYTKSKYRRKKLTSLTDAFSQISDDSVTWINVHGLHNTEILMEIGRLFKIDPLVLEDILNVGHRPKVEVMANFIHVIMKAVLGEKDGELIRSQLSLIVGKNYVISFEEFPKELFTPIYDRLKNPEGRLRENGADYLAYAIMDVVVDNYFPILTGLSEEIEDLDEIVLNNPEPEQLQRIFTLKKQLINIRKNIAPVREVIVKLLRSESPLLNSSNAKYFNDLQDHVIQLVENAEVYREMAVSLQEIYLTSLSNKMNEVMKVLSIIATIFIPLSFLAGIFGMNFDTSASPYNMPELSSPYGYIIFWMICLLICGGLIIFFRRKKWF